MTIFNIQVSRDGLVPLCGSFHRRYRPWATDTSSRLQYHIAPRGSSALAHLAVLDLFTGSAASASLSACVPVSFAASGALENNTRSRFSEVGVLHIFCLRRRCEA